MHKIRIDFYHKEIGDKIKIKGFQKNLGSNNSLTGKNNKSTSITEISVNDNSITHSKLIAENFNEYFVSIGPNLASEASEDLLTEHKTSYPNSNPIVGTIFHFHYINIDDIVLALTNLNYKCTDRDKIPANALRLSADIIAPSLTHTFNLSRYWRTLMIGNARV